MTITTEPFSRLRSQTARHLKESVSNKPQVTLFGTAGTGRLVKARRALAVACPEESVTLTPLLVLVLARCLSADPTLNGWVVGEEIRRVSQVNACVAVQTDIGLLTPVIQRADSLTASELVSTYNELVRKARGGTLAPKDQFDGTVTLTNLGGFRVGHFTPLVNPPQIAIVGVGQAFTPNDGSEGQLPVSLTFDHAAVDGVAAARCLTSLIEAIESMTEEF